MNKPEIDAELGNIAELLLMYDPERLTSLERTMQKFLDRYFEDWGN